MLCAKKEERRMNEQEVTSKVDECIISVCNKVQNNESAPGEYADTVEALAALVEARTKLGYCSTVLLENFS